MAIDRFIKKRRRCQWRACRSKVRYPDDYAAQSTAKAAEAKRGRPLRTYWCTSCHGYHLTSATRRT